MAEGTLHEVVHFDGLVPWLVEGDQRVKTHHAARWSRIGERRNVSIPMHHGIVPQIRGTRPTDTAHRSRSALMIFSRTARTAGSSPPSNPMIRASVTPCISTRGPKWNENVISLNDAKFAVPVESPLKGSVARQPTIPPIRHKTTDSSKNELSMLSRENPNARKVPISRPRLATAAYMVFAAANIAPNVRNEAMK